MKTGNGNGRVAGVWVVALAVGMGGATLLAQDSREQSLVDLANRARQEAGLPPVKWDAGLAAAAKAHAERMAQEGPLSHRYGGEPDLAARAASAGAHFSLIEENIAVADSALHVHQSWMNSPAHHDNLLNPKINRIGVALVPAHGTLYACADYAVGVESMSAQQVEDSVGKILAGKGLKMMPDATAARQYCAMDDQGSAKDLNTGDGPKPRFFMKWQSANVAMLPPQLEQAITSKQYWNASVGACTAQGDGDGGKPVFSGYRVAVLLY